MEWLLPISVVIFFSILIGPSIVRMCRRSSAVKRHAAELFLNREQLTATEFANDFFPPSQRDIATAIRELLEAELIVDATKIRPEDSLIVDLGLGQVDGLDLEFLDFDIEKQFSVSIRPLFIDERGPTVRQIVEHIATANKS